MLLLKVRKDRKQGQMKKLIALTAIFAVLGLSASKIQAQQVTGEASATLLVSSNVPVAGDTVQVTLTVINIDSVPHTFGVQVGMFAATSSVSCHPSITFFNGLQKAVYQPGQSLTYTTTFIAPSPSCVPNNDWLVFSRAQDVAQTGSPIVATSYQEVVVQ